VDQIEVVRQHLIDADGVPGVLSAGWQVFELVRAVTRARAGQAADMYPAFTFSRGAAVSGRNALALAPSLPTDCALRLDLEVQVTGDVYEIADAVAELALALCRRLREVAVLAADTDDKTACKNAASDAERVSMLLAKSA
jgi:hypothetical protein